MTPEPGAAHPTSRLHAGGRLSFRRRVRDIDDDGTLPYVEGGENPPPLAELVRGRPAHVEVEVGPGKGAFLLAAAAARPDTFFLGIEASPAYAKFGAEQVGKAGLANAVLLVDNARLYLDDRVPDGALQAVHVYYPDPWPKRRHRKRRFFVEETPAIVHRCLEENGRLLVATDNAAYAGQIVALLGASPLFVRDRDAEERLLASPPGHGFSPTNFERKYQQEGRILRRYAFRKAPR
ncbi:MAG: tRNA (guanosine(46)-N7)-methyltransferase TrmB [Planctomycetota bacterium]